MKSNGQLPAKPSMEASKRLLQADKYAYTDEEIPLIIDFLHRLAAIDLSIYEDSIRRDTPSIHIKEYTDDNNLAKSIPISQGYHRRTG